MMRVIHSSVLGSRLLEVARALELYAVPAFLTDPMNRVVAVNRPFASLVGDPNRDNLTPDDRFVASLIVGHYRDRFPEGRDAVKQCLPLISGEVAAGRLQEGAQRLAERLLSQISPRLEERASSWGEELTVRDGRTGRVEAFREHVLPVAGPRGERTGFHVSTWQVIEASDANSVRQALTHRQLQIARLYARGLNSRQVAVAAGIERSTARDHLEQIYGRLGVHSRAELASLLARERIT